jgi:hypothetical protein
MDRQPYISLSGTLILFEAHHSVLLKKELKKGKNFPFVLN